MIQVERLGQGNLANRGWLEMPGRVGRSDLDHDFAAGNTSGWLHAELAFYRAAWRYLDDERRLVSHVPSLPPRCSWGWRRQPRGTLEGDDLVGAWEEQEAIADRWRGEVVR